MSIDLDTQPIACTECPIQHRAVCAKCEAEELERLERTKFYRRYAAGQPILFAGDRLDFVASVVSGCAKLERSVEDGRIQMVGLMLPSDFIGRPGRDRTRYDVTAVTDVLLCCFRRRPFEELCVEVPHVGQRLLEMALDELDSAREWMLLLGRKSAREKLATFLVILSRRGAAQGPVRGTQGIRVDLPLTREEMADYLGLTIETVSRQISALKRAEVIRVEGRRSIYIRQLDRLLELAGEDDDGGAI